MAEVHGGAVNGCNGVDVSDATGWCWLCRGGKWNEGGLLKDWRTCWLGIYQGGGRRSSSSRRSGHASRGPPKKVGEGVAVDDRKEGYFRELCMLHDGGRGG